MSCLLTQQMSCLQMQQMSCLQTQQMSRLQTQQMSCSPKISTFFLAPLGKPQSWICPFGWVENCFRPPNGHIGRSPSEIRSSGTNFSRRTLSWTSQDAVKKYVRKVWKINWSPPALVFNKYWPCILGGFEIWLGTWRICEQIGMRSRVSRFFWSSAFRSGLGLAR